LLKIKLTLFMPFLQERHPNALSSTPIPKKNYSSKNQAEPHRPRRQCTIKKSDKKELPRRHIYYMHRSYLLSAPTPDKGKQPKTKEA
jgi:hypothetical protein